MQNQTGYEDKLVIESAAAAHSAGDVVTVGDVLGFALDDAAVGDRAVLIARGEFGTTAVIAGETWTTGQNVYWHPLAAAFTTLETDWPAGRVAADKDADATYGRVAINNARRRPDEVIAPFRFDNMSALGAQGDLVLRDFGADVQVVEVEFISDSLVDNTATVSLGDGSGSNDQILPATAVLGLNGYDSWDHETAPPPLSGAALPVILTDPNDKLVLRIGTADLTAGLLIVRARVRPAA